MVADPTALREHYADRLARSTTIGRLEADRIIQQLFLAMPGELCENSYSVFLAFYRETDKVDRALALSELWYLAKLEGAMQ